MIVDACWLLIIQAAVTLQRSSIEIVRGNHYTRYISCGIRGLNASTRRHTIGEKSPLQSGLFHFRFFLFTTGCLDRISIKAVCLIRHAAKGMPQRTENNSVALLASATFVTYQNWDRLLLGQVTIGGWR
jgi:hypothetical protein